MSDSIVTPLAGDPYWANVVLLCHADGANGSTSFTDTSLSAHVLSASGSAVVSTTSPKFGSGSADFSAGGLSNVNAAGSTGDWNFGAGQFTIEAWGYATSSATTGINIIIGQFQGNSNLGWDFGFVSGPLSFYYSTTGTNNPSVVGSYTPPLNTWVHYAVDRDASNVLRVYVNGSVLASATVSAAFFASTLSCRFGNDGNGTRPWPGRPDEVRVTKGVARYGGAFTPPTAPFPDSAVTAATLAGQSAVCMNMG